ncbi:hypothetical protein ABUE31_03275 [Mesorhizobium sp. ZMM04-5]|uniref:Uncharacterized protein n=1 Tax=Mesorhizobium marinum TaxID=3228790 RepID=A0ABV3QVP8_9HYPH
MLGVWNVVNGKIGAGNPDPLTSRATETGLPVLFDLTSDARGAPEPLTTINFPTGSTVQFT